MKKIYLTLVLVYLILMLIGALTRVKAQEWISAKKIGRAGGTISYHSNPFMQVNENGDMFMAGGFANYVWFDHFFLYAGYYYPPVYLPDIYVARVNAMGVAQWATSIAGENTYIADMAIDRNNNTYVLGQYIFHLILPDTTIYDPTDENHKFLIAYDGNGHRKWIKYLTLLNNDELGMTIDNDNNIIIHDALPAYSGWRIQKINPEGDLVWLTAFASNAVLRGVTADYNHNIFLYGSVNGSESDIVINSHTYYHHNSNYYAAAFIAKLSADGGLQSVETVPGASLTQLGFDAEGTMYMAGRYEKALHLRQFHEPQTPCPDPCGYCNVCSAAFIASLKPHGNANWLKTSQSILDGFAVTAAGDFYMAGNLTRDLNFENDTIHASSSFEGYPAYVLKFNKQGESQWVQTSNGTDGSYVYVTSMAMKRNVIYIAGYYENNGLLNAKCWFGDDTLYTTHSADYHFYATMRDNIMSNMSASRPVINASVHGLYIYPNPSTGRFEVSSPENGELKIYNPYGTTVVNKQLTAGKNEIDLSGGAKGIYVIEVGNERRKIVLN